MTAATTSTFPHARCACSGTATTWQCARRESARGKEGHVVEILARGKTTVVGQFRRERGIDSVLEDGESRTEVLIARGESGGAKPGDIVNVEILEHPTARSHAVGRIVDVLGREDQPGIETEVAMLAHGIPHDWPEAVLAEARVIRERGARESQRGPRGLAESCRS